jgi:hypothetical protein
MSLLSQAVETPLPMQGRPTGCPWLMCVVSLGSLGDSESGTNGIIDVRYIQSMNCGSRYYRINTLSEVDGTHIQHMEQLSTHGSLVSIGTTSLWAYNTIDIV